MVDIDDVKVDFVNAIIVIKEMNEWLIDDWLKVVDAAWKHSESRITASPISQTGESSMDIPIEPQTREQRTTSVASSTGVTQEFSEVGI